MEYKTWTLQNPLAQWFKDTGNRPRDVRQATRVSSETVRRWLTGERTPNEDNMQQLTKLTGDKDLEQKWHDWRESGKGERLSEAK